jgi:hypothetical protein
MAGMGIVLKAISSGSRCHVPGSWFGSGFRVRFRVPGPRCDPVRGSSFPLRDAL